MQSLSARRRVESRWNGDEGFQVRLEFGCRRSAVRGGCGWVRAEFEHDERAEEEAGGGFKQEFDEQVDGASCHGAPRDVEADKFENEGAAEAY